MFNELIKQFISYVFEVIKTGREHNADAIKHARVALRELAKSFEELELHLESGLHDLKRCTEDPKSFRKALRTLVDHQNLVEACNESGVCKDLRIAEEELLSLGRAHASPNSNTALALAAEISMGAESRFVSAIRDLLTKARNYDLTIVADDKNLDQQKVIDDLMERIAALRVIRKQMERTLKEFRK